MKQKYTLLRDDAKQEIVIKEFAELDKEILSFLCEQTHKLVDIETAIEEGKDALLAALTTRNMYPPALYTEKIGEAVIGLTASEEENPSVDIFIDDFEFLTREQEEDKIIEEIEEEAAGDIDDLLEDDIEDDFGSADPISNINTSIKIADDESLDVEDDA